MLRNHDASTNSTHNRGDLKQIDASAKHRIVVCRLRRQPEEGPAMPRGDKSKYTDKQKRQAEHIEEGYEDRGVSKKEAERRAWATVNKESGGGKKSGSGRGKKANKSASKKGGKKAGRKK
jgi:hypothetical protein